MERSSSLKIRRRSTRTSTRSTSSRRIGKPLWLELLRIVRFWVDHGVKTFRVDNPHTKPTVFWEWLIREVHSTNPEVIFLSEAFTRPKVMKALAKAGFAQSYTYFTWRTGRGKWSEYFSELTSPR